MSTVRLFSRFIAGSLRLVTRGNGVYWGWMAFLAVLIASGGLAYASQVRTGLIVTAMRDQVSWGFYIGNFTFLVGVAAAAVVLVIPAYIYDWKPIRQLVVYGELLAISAIVMCCLFVLVDRQHRVSSSVEEYVGAFERVVVCAKGEFESMFRRYCLSQGS